MVRRLLALLALFFPLAGAAQGLPCDSWKSVDFADGQSVCLQNYPMLQAAPVGQSRTLDQLVPTTRNYVLAAPADGPSCPSFVTMAFTRTLWQATTSDTVEMIAKAKGECDSALARQGVRDCQCQIILNQGLSPLSRAQWEEQFLAPRPTVAVAGRPDGADAMQTLQKRLAELEAERDAFAQRVQPTRPAQSELAGRVPRYTARALVIGNSRYTNFGALPNPGRDARAIAAKLRSFGIEVDLVMDAERDDMIHALNEYARRAAGKDVNLLFYAGHGVQVEGINYLIPVNMRADGISAGYVKLAGISLNAALDYLPAKTRLVFLDACRDNPATRSLAGTRGVVAGLAPVDAASGTLIAYATRDGATAADGDGLNSPYTTALLQHLDQPLDISLVLRQVRQTVLRLTSGRQEPWEYGSLVGEQIVLPLMAR